MYNKLVIPLIFVYSKGIKIYRLSLNLCYNLYIQLIAAFVDTFQTVCTLYNYTTMFTFLIF